MFNSVHHCEWFRTDHSLRVIIEYERQFRLDTTRPREAIMSQSTLPVRSTDPETSYAAAVKAALGASRVRPIVLDIVREKGPLTHDELIAAYHDRVVTSLGEVPRSSDSGIRTRLKELAHQGLVTVADIDGFSNYGNAAKRWVVVDPDDPSFVYDPDAIAAYIDDEDIVGFGHFLDGDASDAAGTDED